MATAAEKAAAAAAAKEARKARNSETADYEVVSNLEHDGESYEPGDTVTLTAEQAEPLLGGAIKSTK